MKTHMSYILDACHYAVDTVSALSDDDDDLQTLLGKIRASKISLSQARDWLVLAEREILKLTAEEEEAREENHNDVC